MARLVGRILPGDGRQLSECALGDDLGGDELVVVRERSVTQTPRLGYLLLQNADQRGELSLKRTSNQAVRVEDREVRLRGNVDDVAEASAGTLLPLDALVFPRARQGVTSDLQHEQRHADRGKRTETSDSAPNVRDHNPLDVLDDEALRIAVRDRVDDEQRQLPIHLGLDHGGHPQAPARTLRNHVAGIEVGPGERHDAEALTVSGDEGETVEHESCLSLCPVVIRDPCVS